MVLTNILVVEDELITAKDIKNSLGSLNPITDEYSILNGIIFIFRNKT